MKTLFVAVVSLVLLVALADEVPVMSRINRIQLFDYSGTAISQFTEQDIATLGPYTDTIKALAMGPGQVLHVAYGAGARVRQFNTFGGTLSFIRQFGDDNAGVVSDITVMPDGTVFVVSGQTGGFSNTIVSKFSSTGTLLDRWTVSNYVFQSIDNDGTNIYLGGSLTQSGVRLWRLRKYNTSFVQQWDLYPSYIWIPGNPRPLWTIPSLEFNTATNHLIALHDFSKVSSSGPVVNFYEYAIRTYLQNKSNGPYNITLPTAYTTPRFLAHQASSGNMFLLVNGITDNRIYKYSSGLAYQSSFAPTGTGAGSISTGLGMCAGTDGLWIADYTSLVSMSTTDDMLFCLTHLLIANGTNVTYQRKMHGDHPYTNLTTVATGDYRNPALEIHPDRSMTAHLETSSGTIVTKHTTDGGRTWS